MNWFSHSLNYIRFLLGMPPDSAFVAAQLKKPNGFFARKITDHMNKANQQLLELTLSCMMPKKGDRTLEIGFGNGHHFNDLLTDYPGILLCGLDHSPEMIVLARKMVVAEKGEGMIELKQGSSDQIPWPSDSFDGVYCNNVIYFWEKPEDHLREIIRVLKPGASLFCGFRTRSSMEKLPFTAHGFKMYDSGGWTEVMENCGFVDIRQKAVLESRELNPSLKIDLESVCVFGKKNNHSGQH